MAKTQASTKAINLRIETEHEQLVRDVISRIRKGGPGFRTALRALIEDERAAEYVPARELQDRFADIERQIRSEAGEPERLADLEARLEATERRLADVERLLLERIDRFGADSCGG